MSKGNFLLSQARGKVGDIVFTRLDGEQVARAYNAHPKYSNTIAQATNRMNLATISQAYSAFKGIADHSFEGKSFGMQSMKAFMSENIKLVQGGQGAYLFRNGRGVAPNALTIAKGSIDITALGVVTYDTDNNGVFVNTSLTASAQIPNLTVAQFCIDMGIRKGDEVCFVVLVPNVVNNYKISDETSISQKACSVAYCRFTISVDTADDAKVFLAVEGEENEFVLNKSVMSSYENIDNLSVNFSNYLHVNKLWFAGFFSSGFEDGELGCAVVISRKEGSAWLRSTSTIVWGPNAVVENFDYATALSSYSPEGIKYLNHTEG